MACPAVPFAVAAVKHAVEHRRAENRDARACGRIHGMFRTNPRRRTARHWRNHIRVGNIAWPRSRNQMRRRNTRHVRTFVINPVGRGQIVETIGQQVRADRRLLARIAVCRRRDGFLQAQKAPVGRAIPVGPIVILRRLRRIPRGDRDFPVRQIRHQVLHGADRLTGIGQRELCLGRLDDPQVFRLRLGLPPDVRLGDFRKRHYRDQTQNGHHDDDFIKRKTRRKTRTPPAPKNPNPPDPPKNREIPRELLLLCRRHKSSCRIYGTRHHRLATPQNSPNHGIGD
jgi:hypothetical protein